MPRVKSASRMLLREMRQRLAMAVRGHDLLKEKQDTLIRIFMEHYQEAELLRKEMEVLFLPLRQAYITASLGSSQAMIAGQLASLQQKSKVHRERKFLVGEEVPAFSLAEEVKQNLDEELLLRIDESLLVMRENHDEVLAKLLALAQTEKRLLVLGERIKQLRRRINALKYKTIPSLEKDIKDLILKLDDQERSQKARIMKQLSSK